MVMLVDDIAQYVGGNRNRWGDSYPSHTDFNLYTTVLVRLHQCRRAVTLTTGGHRTDSTVRAMNDALRICGANKRIVRNAGAWFVGSVPSGIMVDFVEGMTIPLR